MVGWLYKATTPRIVCYIALGVIGVFGGLGVVRGLGGESSNLDAINIGEDAVESIKLGCDDYNGNGNALELRPTCHVAQRGNREASPGVSWESDQ